MKDLMPRKKNLVDRFFTAFENDDDFFGSMFNGFDRIFPDCCYTTEDGNVVLQLEVPGFNKENLNVDISDGVLTISGDRQVKDKNYAGQSSIFKRYTVGEIESADAEVKDGILYLTVKPLKPEPKKVKKVEVK